MNYQNPFRTSSFDQAIDGAYEWCFPFSLPSSVQNLSSFRRHSSTGSFGGSLNSWRGRWPFHFDFVFIAYVPKLVFKFAHVDYLFSIYVEVSNAFVYWRITLVEILSQMFNQSLVFKIAVFHDLIKLITPWARNKKIIIVWLRSSLI